MRLPSDSLVVLVGPAGAGKSAWAAAHFRPEQIVSSDALRALVGVSGDDQRAGTDAFAVLDLVLDRRLARRLLTVVDTLGLDPGRRAAYVALAHRHQVPCHAVLFDTPAEACRARNRSRARPVPARVLSGQLAARDRATAGELAAEGFAGVHPPEPVEVVPPELLGAPAAASRQRQRAAPAALRPPAVLVRRARGERRRAGRPSRTVWRRWLASPRRWASPACG